jgi:hypothetical protein
MRLSSAGARSARWTGGIVIQSNTESPIVSKETIMNRFNLSRQHHTGTTRPGRARPVLELLEDRTVLSNYTAATVADINAANLASRPNTIKPADHTAPRSP